MQQKSSPVTYQDDLLHNRMAGYAMGQQLGYHAEHLCGLMLKCFLWGGRIFVGSVQYDTICTHIPTTRRGDLVGPPPLNSAFLFGRGSLVGGH